MGIRIAIDACRSRSGGAKAHLIGFLEEAEPQRFGVDEIHVWSYQKLLDELPKRDWLITHTHPDIEKSLPFQIKWQLMKPRHSIRDSGCQVLLSTDAGTVYVHHPSVVMSRDMLSFERCEIARYTRFLPWFRLFLLRFIQTRSLRKADGALFLTRYAADTIGQWTGPLRDLRIIPHGVGASFKKVQRPQHWPEDRTRNIRCLYISNTAMYKHQWHVVEAFYLLRQKGYHVEIYFVGAGHGDSEARLMKSIRQFDPEGAFTFRMPHVPHHLLPEFLSKADLFIFASSCENMPNTLVEAMSCGLPIACSCLGPMPEVLQEAGVYFHPENPESICEAVRQLIDNPEKRKACSEASRQLASQYSWSRCSGETLEYLVDVYNQYKKKK